MFEPLSRCGIGGRPRFARAQPHAGKPRRHEHVSGGEPAEPQRRRGGARFPVRGAVEWRGRRGVRPSWYALTARLSTPGLSLPICVHALHGIRRVLLGQCHHSGDHGLSREQDLLPRECLLRRPLQPRFLGR